MTVSAPYIFTRQGSGFGGLLFFACSANRGTGVVVLFRPLPPIRPPMRSDIISLCLYRSTLSDGSCDVLDGLAVISSQYCYCYDVLQCP
nr:MAG TPA: hypothetical protein [Caudoviricetes sp.]